MPSPSHEPSTFTLTYTPQEAGGALVSLASTGPFASEVFARKFYSIVELPAPSIPPALFWAYLLGMIGNFLATSDESGEPPVTGDTITS